jgi:hypothetical protein
MGVLLSESSSPAMPGPRAVLCLDATEDDVEEDDADDAGATLPVDDCAYAFWSSWTLLDIVLNWT